MCTDVCWSSRCWHSCQPLETSVEKESGSQTDYLGISGALASTSTLASPILLTVYAAEADNSTPWGPACALTPTSLTAAKGLLFCPPRPCTQPTAAAHHMVNVC